MPLRLPIGGGRTSNLRNYVQFDCAGHFKAPEAQGRYEMCQKTLLTYISNATCEFILTRMQCTLRFTTHTPDVYIFDKR